MKNGWIKLHRKMLNNDELFGTQFTFAVFTILLLMADMEGKVTTGRIEISKMLRAKESTVYKTLKRLEKQQQISMQSNSHGTIIYICKWKEYQQESNNKVTPKVSAKEQQSNTYISIRNKNKENTVNSIGASTTEVVKEDKRNEQVNLILEEFKKLYGHNPIDKQPRRQAWNIIQKVKAFAKKRGKDTTNGFMDRAIKHVFVWAGDKRSLENVKNLDAIRRNLELYFAELERAYEKRTNIN